jgi:hypothetical protein
MPSWNIGSSRAKMSSAMTLTPAAVRLLMLVALAGLLTVPLEKIMSVTPGAVS